MGERIHVPTVMRFSDLDAYGHVNNVAMLRFFEDARVQAFWAGDPDHDGDDVGRFADTAVLDSKPGAGTLTVMAHQEIEYLAQVPFMRAPLDIQLWVGRIGGASIEVFYEVYSPVTAKEKTLYARAATTLVLVDAATGRPRRITDSERAAWEPYVGEPVRFRRGSGS
ncbi:acyl-CoA thioesterase [Gryllotalpicola ginsengisoli]|uniref:acyl-CoA thioesterase n=1 Tax=Gryllotalpicola ginsengisoli TaxID=444608 RepID=UPI0003B44100|nr:thioesterase family protein [Gryllotalpicola ginsengisoli]